MSEELLFNVNGSKATPAEQLTLAEAGLKEVRDLQEWVISHPQILGEGIKIMTMEFDRWKSATGRTSDRLDILGLNTKGDLVVAELKRDIAPDFVEMQALKYAAMASRFTIAKLSEQYARYSTSRNKPISNIEAMEEILRHAPEVSDDTLKRPIVVLVASDFPMSTKATAVWLGEMGVTTILIQYRAYRTGSEISISVSQLYPVPELEEFTISPVQAEINAASETQKKKADVGVVAKLIASGILADGTPLTLRPYGVNEQIRLKLATFLANNPLHSQATWINDEKAPIKWGFDDKQYAPTTIPRNILQEAAEDDRTLRGGNWWVTNEGKSLVELSKFEWDEQSFKEKLIEFVSEPQLSRVLEVLNHGLLNEHFSYCYWGGGIYPSANMGFLFPRKTGNPNVGIWSITLEPSRSVFCFNFQWMAQAGVTPEKMDRVAEKMSDFPGVGKLYVGLKSSDYMTRPSIPVESLFGDPKASTTINSLVDEITSDLN